MLVLTRKPGETIRIGDDIEVTIGRIDGDSVRVVIKAPRRVTIYRGELYERIKACNRQARLPAAEQVAADLPKLDKLLPRRTEESAA